VAEQPPAARAGIAQAAAGQFSMAASIGGAWGLAESVVPLTVFSVAYGFSRDLRWSLVAALIPSTALAVRRLLLRQPLTQALSGLFGVGLGALLAARSGRAEDFFLPSILKNAGFATAYAVSALVRWPVVGVMIGPVLGEWWAWRDVPDRRRAYTRVTWLWVGVFALRLAVQVPLYLAGEAAVLGAANVPLGLPLFGLAVWLSWLMLRRVPVVADAEPPAWLRTLGLSAVEAGEQKAAEDKPIDDVAAQAPPVSRPSEG
jgi:Protein of unknown function (DUF3159)